MDQKSLQKDIDTLKTAVEELSESVEELEAHFEHIDNKLCKISYSWWRRDHEKF